MWAQPLRIENYSSGRILKVGFSLIWHEWLIKGWQQVVHNNVCLFSRIYVMFYALVHDRHTSSWSQTWSWTVNSYLTTWLLRVPNPKASCCEAMLLHTLLISGFFSSCLLKREQTVIQRAVVVVVVFFAVIQSHLSDLLTVGSIGADILWKP